jgi:hypothetical protein
VQGIRDQGQAAGNDTADYLCQCKANIYRNRNYKADIA